MFSPERRKRMMLRKRYLEEIKKEKSPLMDTFLYSYGNTIGTCQKDSAQDFSPFPFSKRKLSISNKSPDGSHTKVSTDVHKRTPLEGIKKENPPFMKIFPSRDANNVSTCQRKSAQKLSSFSKKKLSISRYSQAKVSTSIRKRTHLEGKKKGNPSFTKICTCTKNTTTFQRNSIQNFPQFPKRKSISNGSCYDPQSKVSTNRSFDDDDHGKILYRGFCNIPIYTIRKELGCTQVEERLYWPKPRPLIYPRRILGQQIAELQSKNDINKCVCQSTSTQNLESPFSKTNLSVSNKPPSDSEAEDVSTTETEYLDEYDDPFGDREEKTLEKERKRKIEEFLGFSGTPRTYSYSTGIKSTSFPGDVPAAQTTTSSSVSMDSIKKKRKEAKKRLLAREPQRCVRKSQKFTQAKHAVIGEKKVEVKMKFFNEHNTRKLVLVLQHPMTLTLYGEAEIFAISGSFDILGYDLNPICDRFRVVYSFEELCTLQIKTKSVEQKTRLHLINVRQRLEDLLPRNLVTSVMDACQDSSVILLLRRPYTPYTVRLACSYMKCSLPHHESDAEIFREKGFTIVPGKANAIKSKLFQAVYDIIGESIQTRTDNNKDAPCILVSGKTGCGKSTTVRYFINRTLSKVEKVYYLDADPGQCEFTPPGCVSLVEITRPLLGPTFTHSQRPLQSAFCGGISIKDTTHYFAFIAELVETYCDNFSEYPLFVNTFGCDKDFGKECLNHIRNLLSPKFEVQFVIDRATVKLKCASIVKKPNNKGGITSVFKIPIHSPYNLKKFSDASIRDLSIISYFARLHYYVEPLMALNNLRPYCIRASDIAIHVTDDEYYEDLLLAIDRSLVALCVVHRYQIFTCVVEMGSAAHLPKRLHPAVDLSNCVGFGFVREIDFKKHVLYLVTPEPADVLVDVNALVKANDIMMPEGVYTDEKIFHEPLPFPKKKKTTFFF